MPTTPAFNIAPSPTSQTAEDTISALLNLGYRRQEVHAVVGRVVDRAGDAATLDAVLRDSLKELAQRTTR